MNGQRHLPGMPAPPYPGPPINSNGVFVSPPVIQNIQQPFFQQQPQVVQPVNNIVMVGQPPTDKSGQTFCPYCQRIVVSRVEYRDGVKAWTVCVILGALLLWPFCLIPFCCISCKDVEHYCPSCKRILHIYKRDM
ncbi:lipopolysaccharide-induced tumor necrosis factor-alpha factor homolog [Centropristis striata]|uniref:lipopolysaccharide-induced tumor necrosis factor-alpha factor homolog n=1 Tax=Centropristis striata TaxID=184440 RepID=UPI0027E053D9|nr:lipopolysaccharide-induced tumor necrosis factor-alpha factor homolog [Centropristis striata]